MNRQFIACRVTGRKTNDGPSSIETSVDPVTGHDSQGVDIDESLHFFSHLNRRPAALPAVLSDGSHFFFLLDPSLLLLRSQRVILQLGFASRVSQTGLHDGCRRLVAQDTVVIGSTEQKTGIDFQDTTKGRPKLGGYEVVEDWISGRVDIEEDATSVQQTVVRLHPQVLNVLRSREDDPQRHQAEGKETDKEGDADRGQHQDNLSSNLCLSLEVVRRGGQSLGVGGQTSCDHEIDCHQDEEWEGEECDEDHEVVDGVPSDLQGVGADGDEAAVNELRGRDLRDGQHGQSRRDGDRPVRRDDHDGPMLCTLVPRVQGTTYGVKSLKTDGQDREDGRVRDRYFHEGHSFACRVSGPSDRRLFVPRVRVREGDRS